jgi:hypothetical protein
MSKGDKRAVNRHQMQSRKSADAQERAIETRERQGAAKDIAERVEDMGPQERGTWDAINSWWG